MAIYAWRWWVKLGSNTQEPYLFGAYGMQWPVGKPLHATCRSIDIVTDERGFCQAVYKSPIWHNRNGNTTPEPNCHCGIYALKQPGNATDVYHHSDFAVLGIAEIWGKIITATLGYRAEYGQIRAVVDDKQVSTVYGIPNLPSVEDAYAEYFESGKERV